MEYSIGDRLKHITALEGFDRKEVQRFLYWIRVDEVTDCWTWSGYRDPRGYGKFTRSVVYGDVGRTGGNAVPAHRLSHEFFIGPIPEGFQVHHKCNNRSCVNPNHLEALSVPDHIKKTVGHPATQTHCIRGHEFTPENTKIYRGFRSCRACNVLRTTWRYNPDHQIVGPSSPLYCVHEHPLFGDNVEFIELPHGAFRRRCRQCRREAAERHRIDNSAAILAGKTLRRADTIAGRKLRNRQAIISLRQTVHLLPYRTGITTLRRLLNDCD